MKFNVWTQTDVGLKRESNQDAFLVNHDLGLYIVADGMGGHKGGEIASVLAVETVQNVVKKSFDENKNTPMKELMVHAYNEASSVIFSESEDNSSVRGMGTTMVMAFVKKNEIYIGNVGDSRAYLIREEGLWQLTEDHSLINEQIRAGLLAPEDTESVIDKNIITRSVGFELDVDCDVIVRKLQKGDNILLCSDGLTGMVTDRRIAEIFKSSKPSEVVSCLIDEAKKQGGHDNITVLLLSLSDND